MGIWCSLFLIVCVGLLSYGRRFTLSQALASFDKPYSPNYQQGQSYRYLETQQKNLPWEWLPLLERGCLDETNIEMVEWSGGIHKYDLVGCSGRLYLLAPWPRRPKGFWRYGRRAGCLAGPPTSHGLVTCPHELATETLYQACLIRPSAPQPEAIYFN